MAGVIHQLGLDSTILVQLGLFVALFLLLSNIYFKPFLQLFELRQKRTTEDLHAAKKLLEEAQAKLQEFEMKMNLARRQANEIYQQHVGKAKKEEAKMIFEAREEAKKITQEMLKKIDQEREQLGQQLNKDLETLANSVTERLLVEK